MRINSFGVNGINPYKQQMNKMNNMAKAMAKEDKVEISSKAKEMHEVSKVVLDRQERVEQLKQQIENGTYQIDSKDIAKSMASYYRSMKDK
ncbi:flagellar biosynthesis anti-sigma factor FlgM [Priestia taiwanensis]|uniref:Negative regulator of flagellin synthesis n=1 Tax=Priestia taiwanensis TaxID=1347902 RepID=A0A917AZC9_9BACI|nr:flagellar biosynthesis anti-sigma factor FlgM [Priestia taiwanensis]MBM7364375.1 negative regulator of flagellin synthesis FlgM [Priestia taiwanensis]GGE84944.1 negative regulator of flagellin synthesis [Priestia taiwanensis]